MVEHPSVWPRPPIARRCARRAARVQRRLLSGIQGRWLFPALALIAPIFGQAAGAFLLGCLLFGAIVSLWGAHRTGAVWWIMLWSLATGAFAAALLLFETPAIPSLTVMALATAFIQSIALLGVGAPATIADFPARRLLLTSLAGPLALAVLATNQGLDLWGWPPTLAIALNLSGLPLALMARRRGTS
ncbi:MAG: hypothetical protein J7521_04360 [Caulobacter sp.]|nr:hypothetical protein [Caulobacter sp.]